jgi:hypothetical protein
MVVRSLVLAGCATIVACDAASTCDFNFAMGLVVTAVDASGAAACDVLIEIQAGDYVESKQLEPTDCVFRGAGERAGTYLVSASRNGTVLASERVTVEADECHVKTESVTLVVD